MNANVIGLDYNTQREKLVLSGYGREIQYMVDYAMTLSSKAERQRCAETIISVMERMFPQIRESADYKQKLWDHLAIISNFKLDIDYPFDISEAKQIATKPEPLPYPMSNIKVRHYGKLLFEMFDKLKTMTPGKERDKLVDFTANQMKRCLYLYGNGSADEEKVASDLAHFTDGKIQLDLNSFRFDKITEPAPIAKPTRKRK